MRANDRESNRKSYSGDPEVDAVTARVRMAIEESNYRNSKPRTKASDTSKMNKVYKPKSSPGPATLNLYGAPKNPPASARTLNLYGAPKPKAINANTRENRTSGPKSNSANVRENRVPAKSKPKASKTVAGFKKGSIGEKAISSFKKAYQGK
jgi:hypothetical protein